MGRSENGAHMELIKEIVDYGDGYKSVTDAQTIDLHMNTDTSCCENPGYFLSEDDLSQFIGAAVLSVRVVDAALANVEVPDVYDGGVMFVNIETDKGLLQFVAYNSQNGYYGHEARITCTQLTHSEYL
jgi:hypothetical protein